MEWMDVYDEFRIPTGRTMDREQAVPPGDFLLVVHTAIFDGRGRMLIQKRQSGKRSYPDVWDLSSGGAVRAGETSRQAAIREAREELGLALELDGLRPWLTANFEGGFDDIYVLELETELSDLVLQAEEVADARWAHREEVLGLLTRREFVPYHRAFVELLFDMRHRMSFLTGE